MFPQCKVQTGWPHSLGGGAVDPCYYLAHKWHNTENLYSPGLSV